jgi:hypothetical protein
VAALVAALVVALVVALVAIPLEHHLFHWKELALGQPEDRPFPRCLERPAVPNVGGGRATAVVLLPMEHLSFRALISAGQPAGLMLVS